MGKDLDSAERKVKACLVALHKRSKRWTAPKLNKEVKKAVGAVGKALRFTVRATGFGGEKSFDLCWLKNGGDDMILDVPLAMECELSPNYEAILDDFQKLLVSRAGCRVLLCKQKPEVWALREGELIRQICSYYGTRSGDRYLFGCWMKGGWEFRHYVHQPTSPTPRKQVWLLQANPNDWDPVIEVKRGKRDDWHVSVHVRFLQPGNPAIIWRSAYKGEEAGVYALGELVSAAYDGGDKWRVDIRYTGLLEQPLLKSTLAKHLTLRNLKVLRVPFAPNPFPVTQAEWEALQELAWLRPA
jgi:hypothetical protein